MKTVEHLANTAVTDIRIRKMTDADIPACMAILEAWNMAPRPPSTETPEPERTGIDVANGFVAHLAGRIVGTCSYIVHSPELAETASLAVDPSMKGSGVGFMLQQARLDEMRGRGIRHVRTETDRPETIGWYVDRFGYRVVGTVPKKHAFSLRDTDRWTVLELELAMI
jgi:N-acetylglutamate synthase-like GNAT family acetyltransferase